MNLAEEQSLRVSIAARRHGVSRGSRLAYLAILSMSSIRRGMVSGSRRCGHYGSGALDPLPHSGPRRKPAQRSHDRHSDWIWATVGKYLA